MTSKVKKKILKLKESSTLVINEKSKELIIGRGLRFLKGSCTMYIRGTYILVRTSVCKYIQCHRSVYTYVRMFVRTYLPGG